MTEEPTPLEKDIQPVVAVRNRCPTCGWEFLEQQIGDSDEGSMKCPRCNETTRKGELIGEWDDCAWDY